MENKDCPCKNICRGVCIDIFNTEICDMIKQAYQYGKEDGYRMAEAESYYDMPSPAGFNDW